MSQLDLFADDTITVHCFTCPHKVQGPTPDGAHDQMEAHYRAEHAELIARLTR